MSVFLAILVGGLIVLALIACAVIGVGVWLEEWSTLPRRIGVTVGCFLGVVSLITLCVSLTGVDDHAQHCAAGTRYTEQSQYDPATKTVVTDWWCIPA